MDRFKALVPSGCISLRPEPPVVASEFEMLINILHVWTARKIGIVKIINSLGQLKGKLKNKHKICTLPNRKDIQFWEKEREVQFH